jgi:hypothetical protein
MRALIIRSVQLYAPLPEHVEIRWNDTGRAVQVFDLQRPGSVLPISWQPLTGEHRVEYELELPRP